MSVVLALLVACSLRPAANDPTPSTPDPSAPSREVAPGVFALDGLGRDLPTDDLAPLMATLDGVQLLGLGESIHTSAGFHRAKTRLVRALVHESDFRVVALETPWWRAQRASEWVARCSTGEPGAVLPVMRHLFPIYWDVEVRDLLEDLCDFNRDNPDDPVHVIGWDVQQGPEDIALLADHFGDEVDVTALLQSCAGASFESTDAFRASPRWGAYQRGEVPAADHDACVAGIDALDRRLDEMSPSDAVTRARLSTAGLRAFEGQTWLWPDPPASFEARDEGNGFVLPTLLELDHPDRRTIVWAHNAHLQRALSDTCGYYCGARGLGEWLSDRYGDAYRAVGLVAWDVSIEWPGVQPPRSPIDEPGTLERALHAYGTPQLWVDLHDVDGPHRGMHAVGTSRLEMQVDAQFDDVLFLDTSEAMTWVLP